jgi:hypothetical protein
VKDRSVSSMYTLAWVTILVIAPIEAHECIHLHLVDRQSRLTDQINAMMSKCVKARRHHKTMPEKTYHLGVVGWLSLKVSTRLENAET